MVMKRAWGLGCVMAVILATGHAVADRPVTEESRVSAVEVPVYVLDHDGNSVTDLRPEEFTVYEDGKKQTVLFAQPVTTGQAGSATVGTPKQPGAVLAPVAEQRRLVLIFDLTFNSLDGLKRARDAAWRLVTTQRAASDPVAVFAVSRTTGLTMCTNFTTDVEQIRGAIADLRSKESGPVMAESAGFAREGPASKPSWKRAGAALGTDGDFFSGLEESLEALPEEVRDQLGAVARFDRFTYKTIVRDYLGDLQTLARSLNVMPGRKVVVLLSGGFDSHQAFFNQNPALGGDGGLPSVEGIDPTENHIESQLMDLASAAMSYFSSSDCRFYSVETGGLEAPGGTPPALREDSLAFLASESGGEFFRNANDLTKPFAQIMRETGHYYVLGYTPPAAKGKGAFHKIKVEVSRPAVSISYRKGYYEDKPFTEFTSFEKDLHVAQIVNSGGEIEGVRFDAHAFIYPGRPDTWKEFAGILTQISLSKDEVAESALRKLDLYGFAMRSDGEVADFFHGLVDMTKADLGQKMAQSGLSYSDVLMLRPGSYRLRLVVRNLDTGATGTRDVPVSVPDFNSPGLRMASPCFLSIGSGGAHVRGGKASDFTRFKDNPPAYPLTFQDKELVADTSPVLAASAERPLLVKLYHVDLDATGKPKVRISWRVTDATGKELAEPPYKLMQYQSQSDGSAELLFSFAPPQLPAGNYLLRVTVTDERGAPAVSESVRFRFS